VAAQLASETLDRLRDAQVIAVVRSASAADAVAVAEALVEGGVRAIELTYSVPDVARALREVAERVGSRALVGAGTLTEPRQVREAVDAGAEFLVSPHLDARLLEAMLATGLAALPGILTPSEAAAAVAQGAPAVKLFPAVSVGPAHLRALRGPFPALKVVPTGGIGAGSAAEWLAAGAWAIGVGGELAPATLAGPDARERLVERARTLLAALA
jgi:2-dehydro-3-deoxyphosphogluconate aldolase/(4S)-4-hydroxy-2-oxoglutarate aldolase